MKNIKTYLNNDNNAPFPNGLVILARKARVGYSLDNKYSHFLVINEGIKSHLFKIKIICFPWALCFKYYSK